MPLYEFKCPACGREVESFQNLSEMNEPFHCSACHQQGKVVELKRLISMPAPPRIGPGVTPSSQEEWSAKEKDKLEKRSNEYDKSPAGQEEIHKSLKRAQKNKLL